MARTTPFPFADYFDAEVYSDERKAIVTELIDRYESNLGDSDHAADGYDQGIYTGAWEAYFDTLVMLCEIEPDVVMRYHAGEDVSRAKPAPILILPSVMHVDDALWNEAHAHFTRPELRDGRGYTLTPESGWYLYSGARLVKLDTWDQDGVRVSSNLIEHGQIMRILQDHLNAQAETLGNPVNDLEYDLTEAALNLVLSDAQTGTSLFAWPVMNRLVDRVLTAATAGEPGWHVTSEWCEF